MGEHHVHHHLPKSVHVLAIVVLVVVGLAGIKVLAPELSLRDGSPTGAVVTQGMNSITGNVVANTGSVPPIVKGPPIPPPPPPELLPG